MDDDGDNPLPPPPRYSSQPLSNADFRKLLATPRATDTPNLSRKNSQLEKKAKSKKPYKPQVEEQDVDDEASRYRDRAEERRKGLNPDYEHVNNDLASIITGQNPVGSVNRLSVEDSKFLGGDVEHTHLVKGLDYALLQKVRGELTRTDVDEPKTKSKVLKTEDVKFVTPLGRATHNAIFKSHKVDVSEMFLPRRTAFVYELDEVFAPDVPTTLRRSKEDCPQVQESVMGAPDSAVFERLAKIMSYMHTTTSKTGKKLKRKEKLQLLEKFGLITNGNARPKDAPKAEAKLQAPRLPADDDDIFGDAGTDYAVPKQKSKPAVGVKKGQYFDGHDGNGPAPPPPDAGATLREDDMDLDDLEEGETRPEPAPGPTRPPTGYDASTAYQEYPDVEAYVAANVAYQAQTDPEYQALLAQQASLRGANSAELAGIGLTQIDKDAGLASVFKRDDERLSKIKEKDAREKDPSFVSDAYAECYPGYHEYAGAVVDSDDEDYTQMDTKDKGMSKYDFDTEEQWQQYKQNKEAMPKAAFQFGVKMTDGRKTHKDLGRSRDQKLNSELQKIQQLMSNKYSGEYDAAFAPEKPARQSVDDSMPTGGRNKRLRI